MSAVEQQEEPMKMEVESGEVPAAPEVAVPAPEETEAPAAVDASTTEAMQAEEVAEVKPEEHTEEMNQSADAEVIPPVAPEEQVEKAEAVPGLSVAQETPEKIQEPAVVEDQAKVASDSSVLNTSTDTPIADVSSDAPVSEKKDSVPTRQYLDTTVVPILLQGLATLAKERPSNPIEVLAEYLMKNKDRFQGPTGCADTSTSSA
ncbi:hypothetical protein L596_028243 [Steinernema carpocapsae]|uniref:Dpy-30 histone methyltransferase complex regulatory subunit n=1 Tax=Steinernema carpocapsae TaxID=34508 RepID=A0A4U5LXZ3_STECR|nr:hypothetical protein L596_028243 [Steinernema carpocapsae]